MTTISAPIVINAEGKDVVFDGIDFTKNGFITLENAKSFTMKNCRVFDLEPRKSKDFFLFAPNMRPCKIVVENCYFGKNPTIDGNRLYNFFEVNSQVDSGSSFSENYFDKDCCTHNAINIYGNVPDAFIKINGNTFNYWNFCIRFGMKGSPKCKVQIDHNKGVFDPSTVPEVVDPTDSMIMIQPYLKETSTFKNVTIEVSNLEYSLGKDYYIVGYRGANDTQITEEDLPKVTIDGDLYQVPLYPKE